MSGVLLIRTLILVKWVQLHPYDLVIPHRTRRLIAFNWELGFHMNLGGGEAQPFGPQQTPQERAVRRRHSVDKPAEGKTPGPVGPGAAERGRGARAGQEMQDTGLPWALGLPRNPEESRPVWATQHPELSRVLPSINSQEC